jgi:calcium binding protein 39
MMLRECVRVQELAEIILKAAEFYKFFDYVQKSTFDIASDAFATFKVHFTFASLPRDSPVCFIL